MSYLIGFVVGVIVVLAISYFLMDNFYPKF